MMKRKPFRYVLERSGGPSVSQSAPNGPLVNPPPPKPTRSDARTNRARILAAATQALSASTDASMTSIAKQAGVGVGTLYRHFPSRESLIVELYHQEIQKVIDLAHALAGSQPALVALRQWCEVARYGQLKYGVAEVIHAGSSQGAEREAYDLIIAALRTLLAAGTRAGVLRLNLEADDVLLMVAFLWRIDPSTGGEERAARRSTW